IRLELVRAGRTQTVTIRATVRPAESELNSPGAEGEATPEPEAKPAVPTTPPILGLSVAPLTPALREQYGVPAGQDGVVIVEVQPRTDAARKGFRAGYLIQRADQQPVRTAADLAAAVARVRASGRPSILLAVRSGAQAGPIVLDLDDDRPSGGD
ncbi:MAG TPA: serine protease, partial [Caulobacteraceae bacterium]